MKRRATASLAAMFLSWPALAAVGATGDITPWAASCPPGMVSPDSPGAEITPLAETSPTASSRAPREAGQLVLYWSDAELAAADLARLEKEFPLARTERIPLAFLGGLIALIHFAPEVDTLALRRRLRLSFREATVDVNTRYYPEAGPRQYFARHIRLPEQAPAPAAAIGLIDGPVQAIPALAGVELTRQSFLRPGEQSASPRHGTAVATLAAGREPRHRFSGTAPGARLYSAEILRRVSDGEASHTAALVAAIDWLLGQKVRVINISLGGVGDAVTARAFERLAHLPVLVLAAAGNGGPEAAPAFPGAYPGVLAVTASNAAYEIYALAGQGRHVGLTAPGEALWLPDGGDGRYVSGTSFASALVAGAAARLIAARPTWDGAALRRHLCLHALDLGVPGPDRVFGCGLLQIVPPAP